MENNVTNLQFGQSQLLHVDFIFDVVEDDKVYNISIIDSVEVCEVDYKSFKIIYSRSTKNKEPFFISVSYSVKVFFDKTGVDFYGGDIEKIKKFAETNKIDICNKIYLPNKASVLISNIVRENGNPIVTPPVVTIG